MYSHHISDMVKAIGKAHTSVILSPSDLKKVKKAIEEYWDDKIAISWSIEDVISRAEEYEVDLTKEQARELLEQLLDNHDACIGINWDVMDFYIEEFKRENNA